MIGFAQHDEHQRFLERAAAAHTLAARYKVGTIAVVVIEIVLISSVFWTLARRLRELETLITVCAWTKRVKHNGQWVSFEDFLADRYHLRFTHGISDEARWQMEENSLAHKERAANE